MYRNFMADDSEIRSCYTRIISSIFPPRLDMVDLMEQGRPQLQYQPCQEISKFVEDLNKLQPQVLINVKESRSSTAFAELEWCGTLWSGKYSGLLIPWQSSRNNVDCQDQSQIEQAALRQYCNVVEQPITDPHFEKYPIIELREILKVTKNEINYLHSLRHENIITMVGIVHLGQPEEVLPMVVMELVECHLEQYLEQVMHYEWSNIFAILLGISSGMLYLHKGKKVAHKNISQRTILLTRHLVAKISSFEYAASIKDTCRSSSNSRCDESADVYAFGQVMLATMSPRHRPDAYPSTDKQSDNLEDVLISFASRCGNKCTENHPSSTDIQDALQQYKSMVPTVQVDSLQDKLERLTEENEQLKQQCKDYEARFLTLEEYSFKLTNAFTTLDGKSPLKLTEEYRHIQCHSRAAAARAHKAAYGGSGPVPFHEHTMTAYNKAKEVAFEAIKLHMEKSLFQLQQESDISISENDKTVKNFRLMLNNLHSDHGLSTSPVDSIQITLTEAYENHVNEKDVTIPTDVKEYYYKIAMFSWNAVTKAIPMVLSVDAIYYDDGIHELKDELDDEDDSNIKVRYIYPTLFTSNNWPREVALKGKVTVL